MEERQGTARYLQALAQHWPFIIGSVALALLAALLDLATADDRYEAHADILVTPVAINDTTFVGLPVIRESGEGRGVLTTARLVKTPQVADAARNKLLRATREELFGSVHVEPQAQSNIVDHRRGRHRRASGSPRQRIRGRGHLRAYGHLPARARSGRRPPLSAPRGLAGGVPRPRRSPRGGGAPRDASRARRVARPDAPDRKPRGATRREVLAETASEPGSPLFVGLLLGVGVAITLELVNPLVLRDEDVLGERIPLLARVPQTSLRDLQAHLQRGGTIEGDVGLVPARPRQRERGTRGGGAGTISTRALPAVKERPLPRSASRSLRTRKRARGSCWWTRIFGEHGWGARSACRRVSQASRSSCSGKLLWRKRSRPGGRIPRSATNRDGTPQRQRGRRSPAA